MLLSILRIILIFFTVNVILTNIVGYITNYVGVETKTGGKWMIEPIVGSKSSEQVLIYLVARKIGYATEIAEFFNSDLYAIQKQLKRLEDANILVSQKIGRTRTYQFNPRYPFLKELKELLEKALSFYPEDLKENLLMNRRRPRKSDKPL